MTKFEFPNLWVLYVVKFSIYKSFYNIHKSLLNGFVKYSFITYKLSSI